jgi:hypothetical protein
MIWQIDTRFTGLHAGRQLTKQFVDCGNYFAGEGNPSALSMEQKVRYRRKR